jgi:hypothetical protein
MNAGLQNGSETDGSGPQKASTLRVLRMLETAMGPTIAALLERSRGHRNPL